jgi:excisionase family DNA binding protein
MSPSRQSDTDVLTVPQAAKLLGLGLNTIYEAAGRGEIPHRRIGRRILFSREAILAWLKGNRG